MSPFDDDWDSPDGERRPERRPRSAAPRRGRPTARKYGKSRDGAASFTAGDEGAGARKYGRQALTPKDRPQDSRRSQQPGPDDDRNASGEHHGLSRMRETVDRMPPQSTYSVREGSRTNETPLIESRYTEEPPLLDTRSFIRAAYEGRFLILGLVLVCMVLAAGATTLLPKKYTASASLYFDPTRFQLKWDGQSANQVLPQTMTSLVNSQIEILTSNALMQQVVKNLSLSSGEAKGGTDPVLLAAIQLRDAVTVQRTGDSFLISVGATTRDPQQSAKIANEVVDTFYKYEGDIASDQYKNVTTTLDRRLDDLRQKAFSAEKAVQDYRAKNDLVASKGILISDDRLTALNSALVDAQQKTIEARAKVDAASRLSLQDAVAGTSNTEVASETLLQLRNQYATQAAQLSSLQSQLGARHPSIAAAEASLAGIRTEMGQELKRIVSSAQTELSQAQRAQDEMAKELTAQKALKLSNSPNQAALDNLELQAETARNIYEAMLTRTREANEEYNSLQSNIRVISRAEPPIFADGPSRTMLFVGGAFGGAVLGFFLGLFIALVRQLSRDPRVRSYFSVRDEPQPANRG